MCCIVGSGPKHKRKKLLPFPININRDKIPEFLYKFIPSIDSPAKIFSNCRISRSDFTSYVSSFRVENTWKTTSSMRHQKSDEKLFEIIASMDNPAILDVGVSDGITSLELIEKCGNRFSKYYVTDLYFDVFYKEKDGIFYVYNPMTHECNMRISDFFNIYFHSKNLLPFVNSIVDMICRRAPAFESGSVEKASFCQPDLVRLAERDKRVVIRDYNILNAWDAEPVDIIKIANVLNPSYFSEDQIKQALNNLFSALKKDGWLLVINNGHKEKLILYRKQQGQPPSIVQE